MDLRIWSKNVLFATLEKTGTEPENWIFCQRAELLGARDPTLGIPESDPNTSVHLPHCFGAGRREGERKMETQGGGEGVDLG